MLNMVVHKFSLSQDYLQCVRLPVCLGVTGAAGSQGAFVTRVLKVDKQGAPWKLWALVPEGYPTDLFTVCIVGTGQPVP